MQTKLTWLLAGAAALALGVPSGSSGAAAHSCDAPYETALLVDGTTEIGVVQVCNDATDLHVTYVIDDADWCMTKTHLHVADSLPGIPQNPHGKPIPGRFDYKNDHKPCTDTFGVTIALGDWGSGTELSVAACATVSDNGGRGPKSYAWAGDQAFPDKVGALYFSYEVQVGLGFHPCCEEDYCPNDCGP